MWRASDDVIGITSRKNIPEDVVFVSADFVHTEYPAGSRVAAVETALVAHLYHEDHEGGESKRQPDEVHHHCHAVFSEY